MSIPDVCAAHSCRYCICTIFSGNVLLLLLLLRLMQKREARFKAKLFGRATTTSISRCRLQKRKKTAEIEEEEQVKPDRRFRQLVWSVNLIWAWAVGSAWDIYIKFLLLLVRRQRALCPLLEGAGCNRAGNRRRLHGCWENQTVSKVTVVASWAFELTKS